jgi:hypothetical protein
MRDALPDAFPGMAGRASALGQYAYPTPAGCRPENDLAYDGFSWFATRAGKPGALTATAVVTGPGHAVELLRMAESALRDCGAVVSTVGAPGPGGFTARADKLVFTGWARGDVVLFTVVDDVPAAKLAGAAQAFDAVAVRQLQGRCADLTPSWEASRNPHQGDGFTGRTASAAYLLGQIPPQAVSAPVAQLRWIEPSPAPYPQFALPVAPGTVGVPQVPTLVNPDTITVPQVSVTERPKAVPAAVVPALDARVRLRIPDPDGPGCGWGFLGVAAPAVSYEGLVAAATNEGKNAAENAAKLTVETMLGRIDQASQLAEYDRQMEEFLVWRAYQRSLEQARGELESARTAWLTAWAQLVALPTPTPTPTVPVAVVPAATPTPVPTPGTTVAPGEGEGLEPTPAASPVASSAGPSTVPVAPTPRAAS